MGGQRPAGRRWGMAWTPSAAAGCQVPSSASRVWRMKGVGRTPRRSLHSSKHRRDRRHLCRAICGAVQALAAALSGRSSCPAEAALPRAHGKRGGRV